jgi:hypothetical protein
MFDVPFLYAKIAVAAALLVASFGSGFNLGRELKQGQWDKDSKLQLKLQTTLLDSRIKKVADMNAEQNQINREVSHAHQAVVDQLQTDLQRARAAERAANGLRITRAVCDGDAGSAATAGQRGHDGDAAGTVALPEPITNDLFDLVAEADRAVEVGRSCQAWIYAQGFYGAPAPVIRQTPTNEVMP